MHLVEVVDLIRSVRLVIGSRDRGERTQDAAHSFLYSPSASLQIPFWLARSALGSFASVKHAKYLPSSPSALIHSGERAKKRNLSRAVQQASRSLRSGAPVSSLLFVLLDEPNQPIFVSLTRVKARAEAKARRSRLGDLHIATHPLAVTLLPRAPRRQCNI